MYDTVVKRICEDLDSLQKCAHNFDFNQPDFSEHTWISIEAGRHPVIEQNLTQAFILSDIELNENRRTLNITGPNMGDKLTYMRQTALIVIFAHIGSFVPAKKAIFGPIDRIFTRIDVADDLVG